MSRFLAVLGVVSLPVLAAGQDDGWVGAVVFPRTDPIPMYDADWQKIGSWRGGVEG